MTTTNSNLLLVLSVLSLLVTGCSGLGAKEQPPKVTYSFDFTNALKAYEAGLAADMKGDGKAAISHFHRAIKLFPTYPKFYRDMAVTAKRIGDKENLRYATFFDARIELYLRQGPRITTMVFQNVARDDPSNRVKNPRIRGTARSIVAFLKSVICIEEDRKKRAAEEKKSYVSKYGLETWVTFFGDGSDASFRDCPSVIFR